MPRSKAASTAASHIEYDPRGPVSPAECANALAWCIERGLLRVVNRLVLNEVRTRVRQQQGLGPVYGFPRLGDVDFTVRGARLYLTVRRLLHGLRFGADSACVKIVGRTATLYVRSRAALAKALKERQRDGWEAAGEPERIGRWYVYWWKVFDKGYRFRMRKVKET